MTSRTKRQLLASLLGIAAVTVGLTALGSAASPRFFDDDPIWVERDTEDASGMKPIEISLVVDLAYNLIAGRGDVVSSRAKNVNTVDEVPDSSWFTNRAGLRPLTPADIAKGPDTSSGPAAGPWTITASKSDGVTPGFTVKDASGQKWFLKFDPPGYRAMATGTEVAVTKLMWALGYHVPENHIAYVRRDQLVIGKGQKFTPVGGSAREMRPSDIDRLLSRVDREANGTYRVVASKALQGKPLGHVRFFGTRPDDPNDLVPHEDRRELRGYAVFAAWLNQVDAKAINSLDMLVAENGRSVVRHNLIDFGSTLGSGGVRAADYWAGSEYVVEPSSIGRQLVGFGFLRPRWHKSPLYEAPSIGRLPKDNADFDPEAWKPRAPNQAFLHARADDKFWAAQKLVAINTELLRTAVRTGEFGDPAAEEFLVKALAERRDAIARAYLAATNPISDPSLDGSGTVTFRNAAVDAGVAAAPAGYRAVWSTFDNGSGTTRRIGQTSGRTTTLAAPGNLPSLPGTFITLELSSMGGGQPSWEKPVQAFFQRCIDGWRLVGFERMPER